jgi:hypothetical protein
MRRIHGALLGAALTAGGLTTQAATVFDNFNVNEGHFTSSPIGGSGSTNGIVAPSDATRVTTEAIEGAGSQQIDLVPTATGNSMRLRHLSGGGTVANNTAFTTSSGVDGWIGLYLKTSGSSPASTMTVQMWIEGATAGNDNGSVPKTIIADGNWHYYEWNLDDNSGGADGWGSVAGIVTGSATVADISHTIDSVIFRSTALNGNTTLFMDFVAKSDSGSISALVPEPRMLSLAAIGAMGLMTRRRKA